MSKIDRVEITSFTYEANDLDVPSHGATGVGNVQYAKGSKATVAANSPFSRPLSAQITKNRRHQHKIEIILKATGILPLPPAV